MRQIKVGQIVVTISDQGAITYKAGAAIDSDGHPHRDRDDPCWQPDTSLHHHGRPIDAELVPYIAVPPSICLCVKPQVLGCLAVIVNTLTGASCKAVVADIGPREKIGEVSPACARALGIDDDPRSGGVDSLVLHYVIFAGVRAVIDGITYNLQDYRGARGG